LVLGLAIPAPAARAGIARPGATFADIRSNADVWARWIVSVAGLTTQGVVFTFFPLLAHERGLTTVSIGLVFLVLGLANTLARFPAGWLVDRTGRSTPYAVGGVLVGSVVTSLLPVATEGATVLALVAVFGAVSGTAGVATGVALAGSAPPASRGIVMRGYSTALYLGLGLGSFALGPVITRHGYTLGFSGGGAAGVLGSLMAARLWARGARSREGSASLLR